MSATPQCTLYLALGDFAVAFKDMTTKLKSSVLIEPRKNRQELREITIEPTMIMHKIDDLFCSVT